MSIDNHARAAKRMSEVERVLRQLEKKGLAERLDNGNWRAVMRGTLCITETEAELENLRIEARVEDIGCVAMQMSDQKGVAALLFLDSMVAKGLAKSLKKAAKQSGRGRMSATEDRAAPERWWTQDTTLAEVAVWYAEACRLTPENAALFVNQLRAEGFDDTTLKHCGEERIERIKSREGMYANCPIPDLDTAMAQVVDELMGSYLLGTPGDDYYTNAQIAKRALKTLYSHPRKMNAPYHLLTYFRELKVLSERAHNAHSAEVLRTAAKAAEYLASDKLRVVLEELAERPGYAFKLIKRLRRPL